MLPKRIPKAAKRQSRWRSQRHLSFVRSFACCRCGGLSNVQAAHVRLGSGAGMGQKPDDWNAVSLCADCHNGAGDAQHSVGERTFWDGVDTGELREAFIAASPCRREIEAVRQERAA